DPHGEFVPARLAEVETPAAREVERCSGEAAAGRKNRALGLKKVVGADDRERRPGGVFGIGVDADFDPRPGEARVGGAVFDVAPAESLAEEGAASFAVRGGEFEIVDPVGAWHCGGPFWGGDP